MRCLESGVASYRRAAAHWPRLAVAMETCGRSNKVTNCGRGCAGRGGMWQVKGRSCSPIDSGHLGHSLAPRPGINLTCPLCHPFPFLYSASHRSARLLHTLPRHPYINNRQTEYDVHSYINELSKHKPTHTQGNLQLYVNI